MKKTLAIVIAVIVTAAAATVLSSGQGTIGSHHKAGKSAGRELCMTGAFLSDMPDRAAIADFERYYGKKPAIISVFLMWGNIPDKGIVKTVYSAGSVLMLTVEPWDPASKTGIDLDKMLSGGFDGYLERLAGSIKTAGGPVLVRFAHEMNGDWYPWAGKFIGPEKYITAYRYFKDALTRYGAVNTVWVFSVNWEDIPKGKANHFMVYYPGDGYADAIGIDGYNWGTSQSWSKWLTFRELFEPRYNEIVSALPDKPILITEFSSSGAGGDKAAWIREAFGSLKKMTSVKGFVIFNADKETDWSFPPYLAPGRELKKQLEDERFTGRYTL